MVFSYIAGDIGGTNARINLYKVPDQGDEELIIKKTYKSPEFSSLSNVITLFLQEHDIDEIPSSACFSVAGPVKNGCVNLTNLGWNLSESEMESELGIQKIVFLNDFAACGYGIELLKDEELYELSNSKEPVKGGPKVIIGAGTGLGEAYIFEKDDDFTVIPGEGGHTDFSPKNKVEFELMLFIKKRLNISRVGVERVVSGPGLETIYWFFADSLSKLENPDVTSKIRASEHPGQIISKLAIEKEDVLCEKSLKLFIGCFGAEAGNMALSVLPSGGVYVAGGIAPQIRDVMKEDFLENFYNKGRMRTMLATYPIYVVTNLSIGILGARYIARRKISEFHQSIKRDLSFGDIRSMTKEINLLSQEPISFDIDHSHDSERRRELLTHHKSNRAGSIEHPQQSEQSTMSNIMWMSAGIGFSALIMGAFVFGQRSKNK